MRIACIGYRTWALNIYDRIATNSNHIFLIVRGKEQFSESAIIEFRPDLVLFYGWSWMIPERIHRNYVCLMLHPSPLPRYRGGSPIQNQIIDGVRKSKVTIFVISDELDAGDIVAQADFSLDGRLEDIFARLEESGVKLTQKLLVKGLKPVPQDHSKATYCKRRTPKDSEITLEELKEKNSEYLYNKIRMLDDPYPNAFIRTVDGKKLVIKRVEIQDEADDNANEASR